MFKITFVSLAFLAAVLAQNVEWNECQQNCLDEAGSTACTTAWNETDCFCSTEQFATDVRHCFYENSCWSDIMPFYEAREERCGDLAEDVSFEGRPGTGGSNTTTSSSASEQSASASSSSGANASLVSSSAASAVGTSSVSPSQTSSEAANASASSGPASSDNAAMGLVPIWGSATLVSGAVGIVGVILGGVWTV